MLLIDSTQAKCFSNCPMRYKLNYVDCLRKSEYEEDSVDLRFGESIHTALELLDEHTDNPLAMMKKFEDDYIDLPGEDVKTTQHGKLMLEAFLPYYKANFSEWQTLEKEQTHSIYIGGIEYICKIDRVVKWRDNIYCVDWKTTKSTRKAGFFDRFLLDFQPSGYVKWCKEQYGQCSGFIPVGMFMGYRSRAYKGEPAGFHCSFDYTIVNRTGEDLVLWEKDMVQIHKEIQEAVRSGVWRRNPDHCGSYRGCQYKQLCESCYDEMVMQTLYNKFNPNDYLGR